MVSSDVKNEEVEPPKKSEVARIREQIALEYQATQRLFTDFTPTAKHAYITKRLEKIGVYFEQLSQFMPPDKAIALVVETIDATPSSGASSGRTS